MSGVWNKVLDADYDVNVLGANSIMKLWSLWTDFSKEIIVYLNTTHCLDHCYTCVVIPSLRFISIVCLFK